MTLGGGPFCVALTLVRDKAMEDEWKSRDASDNENLLQQM